MSLAVVPMEMREGVEEERDPGAEAVTAQLERLLASPHFSRSKRLSGFLRFIVEEALSGRGSELKEYTIGTEVYQRSESFDPVIDTIVRVEARRLRAALQKYYALDGRTDPVRIDVPKGGYQPSFSWKTDCPVRPDDNLSSCSIAVLPFQDFSAGRDQRHFCEGLTEELINTLTQIAGLRVVARTSAFSFNGSNIDVRYIGRSLGADAVVEGSVRKDGNTLRITAQLISAGDGYHLWSRQFDREAGAVFAIQESIARSIAAAIHPALGGVQPSFRIGRECTDPDANGAFEKGKCIGIDSALEG